MDNRKKSNRKIIDTKGDAVLHGNRARIDPKKDVVSEYTFYAGIQRDFMNAQANIPITNNENVEEIKKFGEENKK